MNVARELINWYGINKRDLPWRNTRDPYRIWLSEIILQQTRVEQGKPYYERFLAAFPTIEQLATAEEQAVLKLWQGLGYYSRARNLHAAAKQVVSDFNGRFPSSIDDILSLKGVGDYTAAAIGSFAFDIPSPVLDGNVFRFLSRYFGIATPIDSLAGKKEFMAIVLGLIDHRDPATFNQAIMEFGAMQCKPMSPNCPECPLAKECIAYRSDRVGVLPVKKNKTKVRDRYFNYLWIRSGDDCWVKQRQERDIWQNLFEFPLIETEAPSSGKQLSKSDALKKICSADMGKPVPCGPELTHLLSHQKIHARFYELCTDAQLDEACYRKVNPKELAELPVSRLMDLFIQGQMKKTLFLLTPQAQVKSRKP